MQSSKIRPIHQSGKSGFVLGVIWSSYGNRIVSISTSEDTTSAVTAQTYRKRVTAIEDIISPLTPGYDHPGEGDYYRRMNEHYERMAFRYRKAAVRPWVALPEELETWPILFGGEDARTVVASTAPTTRGHRGAGRIICWPRR